MIRVWVVCACMVYVIGCEIGEVHITLGDKHSLDTDANSDHMYTVGMRASSQCHASDIMLCVVEKNSKMCIDVRNPWQKKIEAPVALGQFYNYTGVFFKIDGSVVAKSNGSWCVMYKGEASTDMVLFPSQLTDDSSNELRIAFFADMDIDENSKDTLTQIDRFDSNDIDLFIHIGDFAYNIEDKNGKVGNDFFDRMSPTARRIPYIVTPGNHENYRLGTLFNYRFRMPNTPSDWSIKQNHYFDFLVKGVYFMTINFDYIFEMRPEQEPAVLSWMETRLKKTMNRQDVKWKVFYSHRPIVCNDPILTKDCNFNFYRLKTFEDMLVKYNVSIVLNGHLHIYSRFYPFYNLKRMEMSTIGKGSYLQIINGHAGTHTFYPDNSTIDSYMYSFVERADNSYPLFSKIHFKPLSLEVTTVDSSTGNVVDSVKIKSGAAGMYFMKLLMWITLSFTFIIIIALISYVVKGFYDGDNGSDKEKDHMESDSGTRSEKELLTNNSMEANLIRFGADNGSTHLKEELVGGSTAVDKGEGGGKKYLSNITV